MGNEGAKFFGLEQAPHTIEESNAGLLDKVRSLYPISLLNHPYQYHNRFTFSTSKATNIGLTDPFLACFFCRLTTPRAKSLLESLSASTGRRLRGKELYKLWLRNGDEDEDSYEREKKEINEPSGWIQATRWCWIPN